jgi:hypothetical protein
MERIKLWDACASEDIDMAKSIMETHVMDESVTP